jgi:dihydroorotase
MTGNYLLRNATITNGEVLDVVIESGLVVGKASTGIKHEEIDCKGLVVLPGFVDLHTHRRSCRADSKTR